jgi:hypothetical protein
LRPCHRPRAVRADHPECRGGAGLGMFPLCEEGRSPGHEVQRSQGGGLEQRHFTPGLWPHGRSALTAGGRAVTARAAPCDCAEDRLTSPMSRRESLPGATSSEAATFAARSWVGIGGFGTTSRIQASDHQCRIDQREEPQTAFLRPSARSSSVVLHRRILPSLTMPPRLRDSLLVSESTPQAFRMAIESLGCIPACHSSGRGGPTTSRPAFHPYLGVHVRPKCLRSPIGRTR